MQNERFAFLSGRARIFHYVLLTLCALYALRFDARADTINLPVPRGSYSVGKITLQMIDHARKDPFSDRSGDLRELMVTVFYPAEPSVGMNFAPYTDARSSALLTAKYHLTEFAASQLHGHAFAEAPVAARQRAYPVLIFSPGFGTLPLFYTSNLEDIASHGYIVVAVSHPYSTEFVVFPDGRVIRANRVGTLFEREKETPGFPEQRMLADRDAIGNVWIADDRFVLDELARLNTQHPLLGKHVDLKRVGTFGHSFGGATAAECLLRDKRFLAGVNLDGSLFTTTEKASLKTPFLWFESDYNLTEAEMAKQKMTRRDYDSAVSEHYKTLDSFLALQKPGYRVLLKASQHMTFVGDLAIISARFPLLIGPNEVGTIQPARAVSVIDDFLIDFFDCYLRGKHAALLDQPSAFYLEADGCKVRSH